MKDLDLCDDALSYEGAVSVESRPEGVRPWRLLHAQRHLIAELLMSSCQVPAGVRLTCVSDTRAVEIELSNAGGDQASLDLLVDGRLVGTLRMPTPGRYRHTFADLPAGQKRVELYLPTFGQTEIHRLAIDRAASAERWIDPRKRWITYGSSITMCRRAGSPSRAWPAIVAEHFDWHHTNLGFGGQCHFDPIVARTIAKLQADYLSFCLGINTQGSSFNARTWLPAVTGFILTVRDAHPTTPLAIISPILSPPRETTPGASGLTLVDMRRWLTELVDTLRAHGDANVHYVDGLTIIGPGDEHHMADQLHPEAAGIELMGERISTQLRRVWFP